MLAKSKKSAVILGIIFGIPVVTIAFVAGEIRYNMMDPAERNPNVVNGFAGIGPLLICGAILMLSWGLAALVIYRLNESHYGREGAVRWAVGGTIYGLLQQMVLTPIPSDFNFQAISILKQIGGDLAWKAVTLVLTYVLVFPLATWILNRLRRPRKESGGGPA